MVDVTFRTAASEADLEAWADLMVEGFASPPDRARAYSRSYPPGDVWVAEVAGRVVAALGLCPAAQRWGGRDVPMDGVAAVTTAADFRNLGLASGLMRAALAASRARGRCLSALYPASIALYRKAGYELAGAVTLLQATPTRPPETVTPLAVRPLARAEAQRLACMAEGQAANGNLVQRGSFYWDRTWTRLGDARAYGFFDGDACVGGVILHRQLADWRYDIDIRRYWADDDRALHALLAFIHANGSMCRHATWTGAPSDRLVRAHATEAWQVERSQAWMLRVVDVPRAFEARGYTRALTATTTLSVLDPVCPWNEGTWRIDVREGRATVSAMTAQAARTVDALGLARIYAGIDDLDGITAGPSPWLDERF